MGKRIFICAAIILIIGILAILGFTYFKIEEADVSIPPSSEYYANNFLALERWLNETGRPARMESWYNLGIEFYKEKEAIKENTVILMDPYINWRDQTEHTILPWIVNGKNIIICLNQSELIEIEEALINFLLEQGISVETAPPNYSYNENTPAYHWRYRFTVDESKEFNLKKDADGNIRIVKTKIGDGTLTVTGTPVFMYNYNIKNEINAGLSWELTGEVSDETGVLFVQYVRETQEKKSLFGTLMKRGNFIPVIISILLLIIIGFWMVIPVFGVTLFEKQTNSRPIKDRFAAEISFLKKYKGLYYYENAINQIKNNK